VPKEEDDLTDMKRENYSLGDLKKTWMAKNNNSCIFISAKHKQNIEEFRDTIYTHVKKIHAKRYPYESFLY